MPQPLTLACVATFLLTACADLPRNSAPGPEQRAVGEPGRAGLVLTVARARASLNMVNGRMLWHGEYGGESASGCERVRLNLVNKPEHQWNYLACGTDVKEILDVAPEPARDSRIVMVLESLSQAAWRADRVQRMPYEGYVLEAEPIGPASWGGCRQIEQRLVYQDMLVDVREEKVCRVWK